jgi:hypothetical protein
VLAPGGQSGNFWIHPHIYYNNTKNRKLVEVQGKFSENMKTMYPKTTFKSNNSKGEDTSGTCRHDWMASLGVIFTKIKMAPVLTHAYSHILKKF